MKQHIAIILAGTFLTYLKEEAASVAEQAQTRYNWQFDLFQTSEHTLKELGSARINGAIAIALQEPHTHILQWLVRHSIPTVLIGEVPAMTGVHQLSPPQIKVGELGATHLLEQGLTHFAYIGYTAYFSQMRCQGFLKALASAGFRQVPTFTTLPQGMSLAPAQLEDFLNQLPKPCGIMVCADPAGLVVSRAAAKLGIRIPDELAVVGVGDEDLWCSVTTPPLSSIHFPAKAIGQRAASMLNDLMMGGRVPADAVVPLLHVVQRQSSAVIHAVSPEISVAIRFLRQRFAEKVTVKAAAEFAGISRATLERGVRQTLGRSPFEELMRLRLGAAQELLVNSDLPIKVIANRCGFTDHRHLTIAFRASQGIPPSQYRLWQRGYLSSGAPGISPRKA